ncbi:hypothetical protein M406DRAFT_351577 [Cryphonectria parasitica EP155]|uniref:Uncharacterized protein n=1 Tax=Cryphonectria parasitica (strain ATCC 38755 / EP155) TaxID=660469 RepID=A0A9P4Y049_CRYP1|nr:uncharacterized protein M406DRAFT_351577 [Cryphonectria parasitica EP155]KAF3764093.1 hypothetical protein M406DRAFT_351577 [Cryphonectria parasitica EP155]
MGRPYGPQNNDGVLYDVPTLGNSQEESVVSYRSAAVDGDDFVYEVQREFELVPDIEDELEEFSRLTRMGDFRRAKVYFTNHLKDHIGDAFVFIHYAEMLLEAGDFRSIVQLEAHAQNVFPSDISRTQRPYLNWKIMYWIAFSSNQHDMRKIFAEMRDAWLPVDPDGEFDSTQIRIFCLLIRLISTHRRLVEPLFLPPDPASWIDWRATYQQLLKENRIWDLRDILAAFCIWTRPLWGSFERIFFECDSPTTFFQRIHDDWMTTEADESTHLTLLEIFSLLALSATTYDRSTRFSAAAILIARPISETVLEMYPAQAITRPILYWLLATSTEELLVQSEAQLSLSRPESPGPGLWIVPKRLGCGIPYYMPIKSDNPGWKALEMPNNAKRAVEMALGAARFLGDYSLQVACLQELIDWSKSPALLFDELSKIQDQKQGDLYGHLGTCLSQYLLCETEESKRLLRAKISAFGFWENFEYLPTNHVLSLAARDVLLMALSDEEMAAFDTSIHAALRFSDWLPGSVRQKINYHVKGRSNINPENYPDRRFDIVEVGRGRYEYEPEYRTARRHVQSKLRKKGSHERLRTQPREASRPREYSSKSPAQHRQIIRTKVETPHKTTQQAKQQIRGSLLNGRLRTPSPQI